MERAHELMVDGESKFSVGERLRVSGPSVPYPYDTFLYEIISIEPGKVSLKIVPEGQA